MTQGAVGTVTTETFPKLLLENARVRGNKVAIREKSLGIWQSWTWREAADEVRWLACGLTIFAGITMVSNVRYYSFKDVNLKKSVPFFVIAVIALGFALIAYSPEIAMFGFFVVYGLSGYALAAVSMFRRKSP